MKKLIVFSVIFALLAGTVFAVDLGGTAIGSVDLLKGDTGDDSKVMGGGGMNRIRLEGGGGTDEFGGWLRVQANSGWVNGGDGTTVDFVGHAWWKPIDQFLLRIGGNPDGFYGKDGVTGWGFQQMVSDNNVGALNGANVWGWGEFNPGWIITRQAFYGGFDGQGLMLEIKPIDMLGINVVLPYMGGDQELGDVFKNLHAQIDVNLDFGNIAVTYRGGGPGGYAYGNHYGKWSEGAGSLFAYVGINAIENVGLDVSFSFVIPGEDEYSFPIAAGLGAKIGITDMIGLKLRAAASFGGDAEEFNMLFDVLPYFNISDSMRAFIGIGLIMNNADETTIGWKVNPYLEVGGEWGPTFYVGVKAYQVGDGDLNFAVPIAIGCSF